MQLQLSQEQAKTEWILQSFATHEAEDFQPTTDRDTKEAKLFEGHETYKLPLVVINRKTGRPETSTYIKVLQKPSGLDLGEYTLTGTIRVTPFVMQGRIAYSVVADGVAPVAKSKEAQA